ncbi:MAG: substrate-binding domain-containing protein [Clostridia bacterium]
MKKIVSLMMVFAMLFAVAACAAPTDTAAVVEPEATASEPAVTEEPAADAKTEKEVLIGLLVYNDKNEFIQKLIAGAQAKCDEYGYKLVSYSADKDAATEITNMEDLISLKPDVILYNPVDSDAAEATVGLANAANIPVITVDRVANGGAVVSHVASDNVFGGKLAGEYIVELLGEAGGQVVEIQGQAGTSAARDRGEGFHGVVDGNSAISVVVSQIGNWDKAEGMTVMENALQAYPEIKAVFAHNDTMAMGAMEAAQAANRGDIIIVGFDADDDAVQAVKDGKLAATIAQQPELMGGRGVELANQYLNGKTIAAAEAVEVTLIKTKG